MSTRTVPDHLVAETYARQTIAIGGRDWEAVIEWADPLIADAEERLALWDAYHEGDRP